MKKIVLTTMVLAGLLEAHGFMFGNSFKNCMPSFGCENESITKDINKQIEIAKSASELYNVCILEAMSKSELNICNNNFLSKLNNKKIKKISSYKLKREIKKLNRLNKKFTNCILNAVTDNELNICKSNIISNFTKLIPHSSTNLCSNEYEPVYALKDGVKQIFSNKCVANLNGAMVIGLFNQNVEKPTMCTSEYKPVYALKCGVLKEYSNKCMALKDGAIYIADKFNNDSSDNC